MRPVVVVPHAQKAVLSHDPSPLPPSPPPLPSASLLPPSSSSPSSVFRAAAPVFVFADMQMASADSVALAASSIVDPALPLFRCGDLITTSGFTRACRNGRQGSLVQWRPITGRFEVLLLSGKRLFLVPSNLVLTSEVAVMRSPQQEALSSPPATRSHGLRSSAVMSSPQQGALLTPSVMCAHGFHSSAAMRSP